MIFYTFITSNMQNEMLAAMLKTMLVATPPYFVKGMRSCQKANTIQTEEQTIAQEINVDVFHRL